MTVVAALVWKNMKSKFCEGFLAQNPFSAIFWGRQKPLKLGEWQWQTSINCPSTALGNIE